MKRINRNSDRARLARADLDAVLDASLVGTVSTVFEAEPWVVPMLYARDGDRILLHGSTGAGALRQAGDGVPVSLCVIELNGLVVAHSAFDHSANYRSAVVSGIATALDAEESVTALEHITDTLLPGRVAEIRPMSRKEIAATRVLALPIVDGQWTVKVRTGGPSEPDELTEAWTGVLPLQHTWGSAEPAPTSVGGDVPPSVTRLARG